MAISNNNFSLFFSAFFALHLTFSSPCSKAQTLTDVARSDKLTWYGIDFSEARFINIEESFTPAKVQAAISKWSRDPLTDHEQNYIRRKFKIAEMDTSIYTAHSRNTVVDYRTRVTDKSFDLDGGAIKKIVDQYDIKGSGYGVLLVVESFDKREIRAYVWAVFINNVDKKIISSRRIICKPSSGKIENYWDAAIENAIQSSGKFLSNL